MTDTIPSTAWPVPRPTALLLLADGTVLEGIWLGAEGHAVGEVCFNTAMTGYQEILTDPSSAPGVPDAGSFSGASRRSE